MTRCIYCKSDKSDFRNREHVIPQAFGKCSPKNLVLNDKTKQDRTVCDSCNSKFGQELEPYLAYDSYEGYICRSRYLKPPKQTKRIRVRIKVAKGYWKNIWVELIENNSIIPLKQIGLLTTDSTYDYILLDDIDNLDLRKYDLTQKNSFRLIEIDLVDGKKILNKFNIKFKKEGDLLKLPIQDALCEIKIQIDKIIYRAMAKIAFNYFVYHNNCKEFILDDCFDDIRNFVLTGHGDNLVTVDNKDILADEQGKQKKRLGHIIVINQERSGKIIAHISLFNSFRYLVLISSILPSRKIDVNFGHFFDIFGGGIYDIRKSSLQIVSPKILVPSPDGGYKYNN